jgi:hypothetical protein
VITALVVLVAALGGLAVRALHRARRTFRAIVTDEIDDPRLLDTPLHPDRKDPTP